MVAIRMTGREFSQHTGRAKQAAAEGPVLPDTRVDELSRAAELA